MKGDAANSLYILKEGIAQNQEKGTELRRMDYFGE